VLGISTDDKKTQADFARSLGVEFPMIGDPDKAISKAFGVLWPILGKDRRVTFVIDKVGLIRAVYNHELSIGRHLDDAIEMLGELHKSDAKKS
jgi:alkyl hydroperoxide reductase subunit AhpC